MQSSQLSDSGSDSDLVAPLAGLRGLSKGVTSYYLGLAISPDPIHRVAAWRALFEENAIPMRLYGALLDDCRYAAVRARAFDYFVSIYEHDLAARAAATEVPDPELTRRLLMTAQLDGDSATCAKLEEERFLATAEPAHLNALADHAETANGWRGALTAAVRCFLAIPKSAHLILRVLRLIESASQPALAREVAKHAANSGVYAHVAAVAEALGSLLEGDPETCLATLQRLEENPAASGALGPFLGIIKKARGEALQSLGRYRQAYEAFKDLNAFDASTAKGVDASKYFRGVKFHAGLPVPQLPPDPRGGETVWMLGFPRSGTTLLENALAAHPAVETFEEIPSFRAALAYLDRTAGSRQHPPSGGSGGVPIYLSARQRYYDEIDRRRKKQSAHVLVDKLPMRSGDARVASRLFPEMRYVFSIRHPFDVAFSCFRQRFNPNPAMENFHSIADVARIYDFVMTQWFGVHTLSDPHVCYVRYDDLVVDFEPVLRRVLEFVNLEWTEDVLDFASKAEHRRAKTPSYQKVRQGLSIGVQTYWRNYGFLFQTPEAKPLHKWAEFFGYPTS